MLGWSGLCIWALGPLFQLLIVQAPIEHQQRPPSRVAQTFDSLWREAATRRLVHYQEARKKLVQRIDNYKTALHITAPLASPGQAELAFHSTYQRLPEVRVDMLSGTMFPTPLAIPTRFSWFQVTSQLNHLIQHMEQLQALLHPAVTPMEFEQIVSQWQGADATYVLVLHQVRYLETWVHTLLEQQTQASTQQTLRVIQAITQNPPENKLDLLATLKEQLKPHRILQRSFLPTTLKPGVVQIPIATDIHDKRFIAEIEGALNSFWNQSLWARSKNIRFTILWKAVPDNLAFQQGKQSLETHLDHFPPNAAAMTTGSLTTYVRHSTLVFGLGHITPRTIAHEIGHLLGFPDCYLRTLSGQGLFGLGVLEWNNPFYPDDLMCDNTLGVPRVEVW